MIVYIQNSQYVLFKIFTLQTKDISLYRPLFVLNKLKTPNGLLNLLNKSKISWIFHIDLSKEIPIIMDLLQEIYSAIKSLLNTHYQNILHSPHSPLVPKHMKNMTCLDWHISHLMVLWRASEGQGSNMFTLACLSGAGCSWHLASSISFFCVVAITIFKV